MLPFSLQAKRSRYSGTIDSISETMSGKKMVVVVVGVTPIQQSY
jgi:hypothetical protein